MENTPNNPLNTGNGVPSTTPPSAMPTPIMPKPASPIPAPMTPAPSSSMTMEKIVAMKKYIIAGVAVVVLLVTIYVAYSYFTGISGAVNDVKQGATDLNNKLSTPTNTSATQSTTNNNVVNDLKNQYQPATTTTNPPGITVNAVPPDAVKAPDTSTPPATTTNTTTTTPDSNTSTDSSTGGITR